jgi:hypothetical protein
MKISCSCTVVISQLLFVMLPAISQPLYLNEIMASNSSTILDEDGDAEDWIELYYAGSELLNLSGYGLSDDYADPFKWVLPERTMNPGTFLLVWASGKDRRDLVSPLHTNFRIAAAGEEIILTAPDTTRIDELSPTPIPTGVSIGRQPDGTGDWFFFDTPTPGAANTTMGYQEIIEPVEFSHAGGFYSQPFDLVLSHPDPAVTILYTLDGSEPDVENTRGAVFQYKNQYRESPEDTDEPLLEKSYRTLVHYPEDPIPIHDRTSSPNRVSAFSSTYHYEPQYFPIDPIFKGTVVRAKPYKPGGLAGNSVSRTYFITPAARDRFTLPVVSIAIPEVHLFGYQSGIYTAGAVFDQWRAGNHSAVAGPGTSANYHRRGVDWERPASFELFEAGSDHAAVRQDIGVRIHGGWSRHLPMKTLRLYARNQYGESTFNYRMFPDLPYTGYKRLILRNSGNDWMRTMLRDAAVQTIVKHMRFDTQAYRPVIVFINGEYWGIHNLRERYDRHYLGRVYGVDPDNIDLLTRSGQVKEGGNLQFLRTQQFIQANDMAVSENYEFVRTRIDIENFIDYYIANIFMSEMRTGPTITSISGGCGRMNTTPRRRTDTTAAGGG